MDKNIGFRRNIYRAWLDAAAAFVSAGGDAATVRAKLDPIVAEQVASKENRRMALDILVNTWVKTGDEHPALHAEALTLYTETQSNDERLWLHYGLTLLAYPFFRLGVAAIGQQSQFVDTVSPKDVKKRLTAEMGQLGALEKACERIVFSLRDWGILTASKQRYAYEPRRQGLATSNRRLELWLLAVALTAHPAEELLYTDLTHLPELFPFALTVTIEDVRRSSEFVVHRQGIGWDMVSLRKAPSNIASSAKRSSGKRRSTTGRKQDKAEQLQLIEATSAL